MTPGQAGDDDEADGPLVSRKTLVRILIVLGIGIPIVVEGLTFVGLVGNQLGDGGDGGPATPAEPAGVDIGEDLLPGTEQVETLRAANVSAGGEWEFTLRVGVTNTGPDGYELTVGPLTTESGNTISGTRSTGPLAANESRDFTGSWPLPRGDVPTQLEVSATVPTANGTRTVDRAISLETVSIQG